MDFLFPHVHLSARVATAGKFQRPLPEEEYDKLYLATFFEISHIYFAEFSLQEKITKFILF